MCWECTLLTLRIQIYNVISRAYRSFRLTFFVVIEATRYLFDKVNKADTRSLREPEDYIYTTEVG